MERVLVKQAVKAAVEFLRDVQEGSTPEDVSVEEVELSDQDATWRITLGYSPPGSSINKLTGKEVYRQFKIFQVDAQTGEVISMKIREF